MPTVSYGGRTFNFTQSGGALAGLGIFGGNTQLSSATGGLLGNGGSSLMENFAGYFTTTPQHPRDLEIAEELGGFAAEALRGLFQETPINPAADQRMMQLRTRTRNLACWQSDRGYGRRRVRLVKVPDPTAERGWVYTTETYCAPRRMNPLNPKALARAGRRVGSFCRIASGMQKMLEKAIRKGGGSSRRRSSYSCSPKRCP